MQTRGILGYILYHQYEYEYEYSDFIYYSYSYCTQLVPPTVQYSM